MALKRVTLTAQAMLTLLCRASVVEGFSCRSSMARPSLSCLALSVDGPNDSNSDDYTDVPPSPRRSFVFFDDHEFNMHKQREAWEEAIQRERQSGQQQQQTQQEATFAIADDVSETVTTAATTYQGVGTPSVPAVATATAATPQLQQQQSAPDVQQDDKISAATAKVEQPVQQQEMGGKMQDNVAPTIADSTNDTAAAQMPDTEENDTSDKEQMIENVAIRDSGEAETQQPKETKELSTNAPTPSKARQASRTVSPTSTDKPKVVTIDSASSSEDSESPKEDSKAQIDNNLARRREYFARRIAESRQRALLISLANRKSDTKAESDKFNPLTVEASVPKSTLDLMDGNEEEKPDDAKWKPTSPYESQQKALLASRLAADRRASLANRGFKLPETVKRAEENG